MRVGSLFSGIGGIDLGLQRAGMEIAWQVEIDPWCRQVLEKHWPDAQRYEDVREVGAANLEHVDLIAGGFPCQPHSVAGKRLASADERDLWGEFCRIICEVRPRWVLAENVPGLLSSESGRFFGRVLRDLAKGGYDAEWQVLPAAAFGAPHIRERVFIVAYPASDGGNIRLKLAGNGWQSETQQARVGGSKMHVANTERQRLQRSARYRQPAERRTPIFSTRNFEGYGDYWAVEPDVGRVANGVPDWVDRLRALGNAVVPQVAEYIGRLIIAQGVGA